VNHEQAVLVTRAVRAMCPAQTIDEATPDFWAVILRDVRYEDATVAVERLGAKQRFIAPSEIVDEVAVIRSVRLDGVDQYRGHYTGNPDDARAELDWWRNSLRRIGDGEQPDDVFEPQQLTARKMPELGGVFRKVPDK
jgi:hypothetical protein